MDETVLMGRSRGRRTTHSKHWNWFNRMSVWLFFTVMLTLVLGVWIFNPWEKVRIASEVDEGDWSYIPIPPQDSLKDSLSEVLGTKFNLDWYNLCIKTGGVRGEMYLVKFGDGSSIALKDNDTNCDKGWRVSERFVYSIEVNLPSTEESNQKTNVVYSADGKMAYVPGSIAIESGEIYAKPNSGFVIAKFVSIWLIINILLLLAMDMRGYLLRGWD